MQGLLKFNIWILQSVVDVNGVLGKPSVSRGMMILALCCQ